MTSVQIYELSKVPQQLVSIIRGDFDNQRKKYEEYQDIYDEQLLHIKEHPDGGFFIAAYDGPTYLGGVCLFIKEYSYVQIECPCFQAIAKSIEGIKSDFKLNQILIPAMEEFVKSKGFDVIRCAPYEQQARILKVHYGFVSDEVWKGQLIKHL